MEELRVTLVADEAGTSDFEDGLATKRPKGWVLAIEEKVR